MGIEDYSTTAANNNAAPPNGAPEQMIASAVNDVIRQVMASIRTWYEDAQWIDFGHTPTRVDGDTFTVATDLTAVYQANRRVKMTGSATAYATIVSSSYSAPNTTVELSSSAIPATLTTVSVGILSGSNNAIPGYQVPWTATLTGVSGTVTGTGYYYIFGGLVFVTVPALSGTGNATDMTVTGLPVAARPSAAVTCPIGLATNAALERTDAGALIGTNGVISYYLANSSFGWSATQVKGFDKHTMIFLQ